MVSRSSRPPPTRRRHKAVPWGTAAEWRERDKARRLRYAASGMDPVPAKARVPAVKVAGELVIEDAGTDLEQEVGAAGCPAHLLFYHALADDLVDRWLSECGGDGLASRWRFP